MKIKQLTAFAVAAAFSMTASAAIIDIDISGVEVTAAGTTIAYDLNALGGTTAGADVTIDGVGWELELTAFDPSWLSEAVIDVNGEVSITPSGTSAPGTELLTSGGIILLADAGLPNIEVAGGTLTLTFFDTFDDGFEPQAVFGAGSVLSFSTVMDAPSLPEPGSLALLFVAGIGSLLAYRKRQS